MILEDEETVSEGEVLMEPLTLTRRRNTIERAQSCLNDASTVNSHQDPCSAEAMRGRARTGSFKSRESVVPCGRETIEMMRERWAKLYRDFYSKRSDTYDLSKIPDIHDCIRYDALHNAHLHLTGIRELLDIASSLAHALVPQEYGINMEEKVQIGSSICRTLLMKMKDDLDLARGLKVTHRLNPSYAKKEIKSTHRSVRTRLYFTSESHLHTLLNVLRYPPPVSPSADQTEAVVASSPISKEAQKWIEGIPELCYMTHFVIRVFERFQYPVADPKRYRLEILVSPGADGDPLLDSQPDKALDVASLRVVSRDGVACQDLVDYLADYIEFAQRAVPKETLLSPKPKTKNKTHH